MAETMDPDFAIDPRLLNLATASSSSQLPSDRNTLRNDDVQYDDLTRDETPPIASSALASALRPELAETHSNEPNEFDAIFRDLDSPEDGVALEGHAVGHLALWIAKNESVEPSDEQLKGLEIVTAVPRRKLSRWIRWHGNSLLARARAVTTHSKVSGMYIENNSNRARCLTESGFRHRLRISKSNGRKPFGCTNKCGQSFKREGDWCRHEKLNFEEWVCPHCPSKVLSRHEHLQKHFKDEHPAVPDTSKQESRYFQAVKDRPCGFCAITLASWNNWLFHVASHFEGSAKGGAKDISTWLDYSPIRKAPMTDMVAGLRQTIEPANAILGSTSHSRSSPLSLRRLDTGDTLDARYKRFTLSSRRTSGAPRAAASGDARGWQAVRWNSTIGVAGIPARDEQVEDEESSSWPLPIPALPESGRAYGTISHMASPATNPLTETSPSIKSSEIMDELPSMFQNVTIQDTSETAPAPVAAQSLTHVQEHKRKGV
jgi:hypothetical protein